MFIDAHFHAWQLDRGDYGWLTPALKPIYRNVTVADWQCQAELHGVTGGVLVQAAPTEPETHYLLALAAQNQCVLGVVGWVDLLAADAPARISQLTDKIKLKGLRPMLHDLSDPAWMLQSALAPAMQAMADCGLVFDALVERRFVSGPGGVDALVHADRASDRLHSPDARGTHAWHRGHWVTRNPGLVFSATRSEEKTHAQGVEVFAAGGADRAVKLQALGHHGTNAQLDSGRASFNAIKLDVGGKRADFALK